MGAARSAAGVSGGSIPDSPDVAWQPSSQRGPPSGDAVSAALTGPPAAALSSRAASVSWRHTARPPWGQVVALGPLASRVLGCGRPRPGAGHPALDQPSAPGPAP